MANYQKAGDGLTRAKDDALLAALLQGASNRTAAVQSGYSEATVYRRLNDAQFKRRYADARFAIQEQTLTAVIGAGPKGVLTLMTLMSTTDEMGNRIAHPVRLAAAKAVVELGIGTLARVQVDATLSLNIEEATETLKARLRAYHETGRIEPDAIETTEAS